MLQRAFPYRRCILLGFSPGSRIIRAGALTAPRVTRTLPSQLMKYCQKCRSAYPNEFNVCPIDNSTLGLTSELLSGMVIRGKYLIDEKIGEGGMGVVYRARHLAFNEILALKVVHALLAEDASLLKRFKTEAIVTRRLQHPNAVRIHDLDSTEDGRPFIVMELVEGGSLKDLIARTGPLSVARAVAIAIQTFRKPRKLI